jgi:hypothetical protein
MSARLAIPPAPIISGIASGLVMVLPRRIFLPGLFFGIALSIVIQQTVETIGPANNSQSFCSRLLDTGRPPL